MLRILRAGVNTAFNSILASNWRQDEPSIKVSPDKAAMCAPPLGCVSRERLHRSIRPGGICERAQCSSLAFHLTKTDFAGLQTMSCNIDIGNFKGSGMAMKIIMRLVQKVLAAASFGGSLRTGPQDQWSAPAANSFSTLHALDNNASNTACAEFKDCQDADQYGINQAVEPLPLAGRAITGIAHGTEETAAVNGVMRQITAQTAAMSDRNASVRRRGCTRSGRGVYASKKRHPIVKSSFVATEYVVFSKESTQPDRRFLLSSSYSTGTAAQFHSGVT